MNVIYSIYLSLMPTNGVALPYFHCNLGDRYEMGNTISNWSALGFWNHNVHRQSL